MRSYQKLYNGGSRITETISDKKTYIYPKICFLFLHFQEQLLGFEYLPKVTVINFMSLDTLYSSCSRWFSKKKETKTCGDPPMIQETPWIDTFQQSVDRKRHFCPICDDTSGVDSSDNETSISRWW